MLTDVSVCCAFRPIACLKLISIMRLCVPVLSYFGVKLVAKMLTEEFLWVVVGVWVVLGSASLVGRLVWCFAFVKITH